MMPRKITAPAIAPDPAPDPIPATPAIPTIKGFNTDWTCLGHKFEIGKTYTHDGAIRACQSGFHAIEGYPLEVFDYYPPGQSKYGDTASSGAVDRDAGDSKIASAVITINAELHIPALVERAVKWVIAQCKPANAKHSESDQSAASSTGDQSAASSTGDQSAASSTGYRSAASSTGYRSAASSTGYRSAASSTGYQSAASSTGYRSAASSTGDQSAASSTGDRSAASSTGDQSAASSTGYRSAASSTGDRSAASSTGYRSAVSSTGDWSAASSTGDQSAASSTGYRSAASSTGYRSAAMSAGLEGRAMGMDGCALFLVYRDLDTYHIKHAWGGIVGQNGIKSFVWYQLDVAGQPVEVDAMTHPTDLADNIRAIAGLLARGRALPCYQCAASEALQQYADLVAQLEADHTRACRTLDEIVEDARQDAQAAEVPTRDEVLMRRIWGIGLR